MSVGGEGNKGGFVDPAEDDSVPGEYAGEEADTGAVPGDGSGAGLPWLMARLGRLLERFGPDGVVVMSGEEYDRAQAAMYAAGWQDAAEEYTPRIAAARWEGWLGRWRPLRVMEEPGEVIDFPAGQRAEGSAAGPQDPAAGGPGAGGSGAGSGTGAAPANGRARGGTPVPRPFLSPKSRRSKSPTIPRLPARDPHRPRRAADASDGQAPGPAPAPDEPGE
jgi:hypothetical protein